MIPIKLQLKNFLSYGAQIQTIDFSPYPLICLSGKNGHGKSALLDAITWALWGQARKVSNTAKADQGLVRLGQTQMMVLLNFECAGQTYRVRREYMITYGKPYATLEFGILNTKTDTVTPLSDKTIRKTQEKIEQTLRIDFQSFCNSAFLRQGNANEFSQKSPKDRKEVLTNILGLNRYDALRKLAAEKAKTASAEQKNSLAFQEKCESELKEKDATKTKTKEVEKQLVQLTQQEKQLFKEADVVKNGIEKLTEDKHKENILTITLNQINEKESLLQQELHKIKEQWQHVDKQQQALPDTKELQTQHALLIKKAAEHQKKLQTTLKQKEELLELKEKLYIMQQKHQAKQASLTNTKKIEIERCEAELANAVSNKKILTTQQEILKNELNNCSTKLSDLKKQQAVINVDNEKFEQLTKQFEKRKSHYHNFLAQGNLAKNELDQLKQKMLLADDDDAPSCSLCEQNLSASRKRFLKQKFITTKQFLLHRLHKLKKIVVELKQLLTNDHETLEMYRKKREEHTLLQVKINQKNDLAKKITETFSANEKQCSHYNTIEIKQKKHSAQLKIELQEITHNTTELLKKNTSYLELSKQLEKLQKELVTAPYNAQEHQVIQKELEIIEKKITDYADIQKQITQQGERKKTIDKLSKQLKQIDTEKCTIIKQIDQYKTLPEQEKKIRASKLDIDERYKKIKEEKNLMLEERGGLTTKTKMLEQIEKEYHQHKKTFSTLEKTKKNYQAIALAAGKDGIQALLIEDAIPEIEQEANELLSKLTNNQSQIILESLRDLKKGGTKETLDIKISDTSGIRAYELFSGGEAFRIDFALRVAISKLLARRAGTSLQTLIIDEGFGSQDEEGLSNIMDALHKIQDDFSKIIIVSHLTTMKDQFPVHFVVQKGPNGSTVNILEQG